MKRKAGIGLAILVVFGLLGICMGYTRDVSRGRDWAILYALEALINHVDAPAEKTPTPLVKEVATSGTRVALVASETFATKAYLMAKKTAGANTGLVYIGDVTVDVSGPQIMTLAPGDDIVLYFGPGTKFDLAKIYIDCAAGNTDGVTGFYVPE